jgi:cytochrome c oxidase cbb3-type subunit III
MVALTHRLSFTLLFVASTFGCRSGATPTPEPGAVTAPSATATGVNDAHSASKAAAAAKNEKLVGDGAGLYARYCALCHGPEGKGYAADNAPSLVTQSFLESASDPFIASGIRVGRPGTAMAAYGKARGGPLDESEIRSIVAFIRSKGPTAKALPPATAKGDAERGAALYQAQCATCHGTEQARSTAVWLFNPELLRSASNPFLRHAITHGRPPTPMVAFGQTLGAQGVEDLVMFLQSKAPQSASAAPKVDVAALEKLPVVINPNGKTPSFTLREERFVGVDQVKVALEKKQRMIIIDARSPSDFIASHIPGAISNGYYDKAGLDRIKNDGTWIIAYCACPHHASGEVVDELRRRGFKNTAVLDEGILQWQHRGYPVTGESKAAVPAPPPLSGSMPPAPPVPAPPVPTPPVPSSSVPTLK